MKRVACFQVFVQRQKNPMQTRYPFLTASQIQAKLRQHWKNLDSFSQMSYSKTVTTKNSCNPLNKSSKEHINKSKNIDKKRLNSTMNANRGNRGEEKLFFDPSVFDDVEFEANNKTKAKICSKVVCRVSQKDHQGAFDDTNRLLEQEIGKIRHLDHMPKQRTSGAVKFSWDDDDENLDTDIEHERRDDEIFNLTSDDDSTHYDMTNPDRSRIESKRQDHLGSMFQDAFDSQEAENFVVSRRLLSSAAVQGDKNFECMFEDKDIFE